jgi:hypothetical protein
MASQPAQQENVLEQYLMTSTKYHPVPVPARVDRAEAERFVQERAQMPITKQMLGKLSRLAIFHNLSGTAGTFADFLNKRETKPDDYARTAVAVTTIAWIGNEAQVADTQKYFQNTLRRADGQRDREVMFIACDALADPETIKSFREWIDKKVKQLEGNFEKDPTPENREALARAQEFRKFRIRQLDNANEARGKLQKQSREPLRAQQLVQMYLREAKIDAPTLEYWAAITLVHSGRRSPRFTGHARDEFLKAAKRCNRENVKLQPELNFRRARSLRAAEFFGAALTEEDETWLKEYGDDGADAIALRPDWEYGGGLQ